MTKKMQRGIEDLINSGRYDTIDTFTVVLQPFMKYMTAPKKVDLLRKNYLNIFLINIILG
mgnify:CR=1 FL=1